MDSVLTSKYSMATKYVTISNNLKTFVSNADKISLTVKTNQLENFALFVGDEDEVFLPTNAETDFIDASASVYVQRTSNQTLVIEVKEYTFLGIFEEESALSADRLFSGLIPQSSDISKKLKFNDSSDSAIGHNMSVIQAALDAGGDVRVDGVGAFYVNDTIVIGDNTELAFAPKCFPKMVAGVNKTLVCNRAFLEPFSTVTVAWTSGPKATVTWAGHGREEGQAVWLRGVAGTSPSQYSGVFTITSVIDANNFEVRLRRTPTAAPAGTYECKRADVNVGFYGRADYNVQGNPDATGTNMLAIVFGGVRKLDVLAELSNTKKYCLCVGAVANFKVHGLHSGHAGSDGLKIYGPAFDGIVERITGVFNDDLCSIQPQEAPGYAQYDYTGGGDAINIKIKNISGNSLNASLFVLYSSQNQYADGIEVDGVSGESAGNPVKLYTGVGYTNCKVGSVKLKNIYRQTNLDRSTIAFDGSQQFEYLEIDGFYGSTVAGIAGLTKSPIGFYTGSAGSIAIKNCHDRLGSDVPFISTNSTFAASNFDISHLQVYATNIGRIFSMLGTGGIRNVTVSNIKSNTLSRMIVVGSGMTSVPKITLRNMDANAPRIVEALASCDIHIGEGSRFTASNGVVSANGAGINVKITGEGSELASGNWLEKVSTPNITVMSRTVKCDVTLLARTNGAMVYNTNAAAGTLANAGVVVCDHTAAASSWKLTTNTSLAY